MVELSASSRRGVVVAPHYLAVEAGRGVLAEGGNALEAAIAAAAAIIPAYPHMNHIGGDGFWIIREPSGRIRYVEACGFAGAKATRALYAEHGFKTIPARGPLAALTVPGAVGGWMLACEAAKTTGGKMPLSRLLEPALAIARQGSPVSRSMSWRLAYERATDIKAPGFAETFLIDGKPPREGAVLSTGRLVDTFERLIAAGLDDFYRGDVGREIAADLDRIGSPVTRADLERYRAVLREPLPIKLAKSTVYTSQPPTQGLATLLILGIFERLAQPAAESFAYVHGIIEATKRAFKIRDRVVTDFDRLKEDPAASLTPAVLEREAKAIDLQKAAPWPEPAKKGDTIWLGAVDASGLAVSYIQSLFWEFGSGCVLPSTGIVMQNRGSSFSLNPKALNALEPGRRPFHTLCPALAVLDDGRILSFGTMGGEGQPQTLATVYTRLVTYNVPIAEAIDRPRWLLGRTWGTEITNVRIESRFPENVIAALKKAAHDIEVLPDSYYEIMGHAGGVTIGPKGEIEGAHDRRSDGGAAGA
ncbi:MAG TPA: gamma-glutamyltransferase [Xanthobacteraceae bacterium]|nr:gamma-glutamyltransferase [Xanthobacteraceae bacterium]